MTRIALLAFLGMISWSAVAQYNGPAVEACRAYAKRELALNGNKAGEVAFERDQALSIDRYTRKLGSQFVSSVLMGNGAIVLEGAPSAELSFICLLADEKRPVFFYWLPREGSNALAQCTRNEGSRGKPRACLEFLLQVAEQDLGQIYAIGFQEARERDAQSKSERFTGAYRTANTEWLQYRDAECARRLDLAPTGVVAEDYRLACIVDLTRRRALDMR